MAFINCTSPFDLAVTLDSGQAFRWQRIQSYDDAGPPWYEGVLFSNRLIIRQTAEGFEWHTSPDSEDLIEPMLIEYLRLDDDFDAISEALRSDDVLRQELTDHKGLRILRQDPWECLISFICSANNNIPRIKTNVEDIAKTFGSKIPGSAFNRNAFPSPLELAGVRETNLREIGLGFRAKYIVSVANRIAEREIDLFALRETSYEAALETLVTLNGVGDKIANCVLLFSLDKLEAFPVDVWIDRALRDWYFTETESKVPRSQMRSWAQNRFGMYAGYANQYLFQARRLDRRT